MRPYTREEWDLDPSEGRGNATRMRLTVDALFARAESAEAELAAARERLDEFGSHPTVADGIQAMRLRMLEIHARADPSK